MRPLSTLEGNGNERWGCLHSKIKSAEGKGGFKAARAMEKNCIMESFEGQKLITQTSPEEKIELFYMHSHNTKRPTPTVNTI